MLSGEPTISVARSGSDVDTLRGPWHALRGDVVSTDPEWFEGLLRVLPGGGRPHVLALERDGAVEAMAVGNVRTREVPCRVGRKALYSPTASTLSIMEDGFLGRIDDRNARLLVRELRAVLDRGEAQLCLLLHLSAASPIRTALESEVGFVRRARSGRLQKRWSRPLPDTYDAFLATLSPSARKGMRQTAKRVERGLAPGLELRRFRDEVATAALIEDALRVARLTYQWRRGVGFRDTELTRWTVTEAARRALLRAWILYDGDRPIAFEWGIAYNGTFRWVDGGFDPSYAEHRVGMYLIGRAIEDLCEDPDVTRIDFGLGDGEYKRRLGCTAELEGDMLLAAVRPRSLWVASAYSAATRLTRLYRKLPLSL